MSNLFFTRYRGLLTQDSVSKLANYRNRTQVITNLGPADAEIKIGQYTVMLYNYREQAVDYVTKIMRAEKVCKIHIWLEKEKVMRTKVYKWDTYNQKKPRNL